MKSLTILFIFLVFSKVNSLPYQVYWAYNDPIFDDTGLIFINPDVSSRNPIVQDLQEPVNDEVINDDPNFEEKEGKEATIGSSSDNGNRDDDISITGPISQVISPSISGSNGELIASNVVNSNHPGSSLSKPIHSGLNVPVSGLTSPISGLTSPISGLGLQQLIPLLGSLQLPNLAQLAPLSLSHLHELLQTIIKNRVPILRPTQVTPGNVLIPGYTLTVGAGGVTLPGIIRH